MAIAQSDFNIWHGNAYEGQVSTIDVNDVISRMNKSDDSIAFGRVVVRHDGYRDCAPITADSTVEDILGIAVRTMAQASITNPYPNATGNTDYIVTYAPGQNVSILRRGRISALCVDGAAAGETVTVITADGENQGRLTGSDGTGLALNQVRWVEDVEAGQIGEIQLDAILNIDAPAASATAIADVDGLQTALNNKLDKTATATAATKLATKRKIAGKDFDGTADITITAADVGAEPSA